MGLIAIAFLGIIIMILMIVNNSNTHNSTAYATTQETKKVQL